MKTGVQLEQCYRVLKNLHLSNFSIRQVKTKPIKNKKDKLYFLNTCLIPQVI
jgi:hypothetical protein